MKKRRSCILVIIFQREQNILFLWPPPHLPKSEFTLKKGGGNDDLLAKNHYHLLHLGKSSWVFEFPTQCTFLMLVKLMKRMDDSYSEFSPPITFMAVSSCTIYIWVVSVMLSCRAVRHLWMHWVSVFLGHSKKIFWEKKLCMQLLDFCSFRLD